MFEMKKETILLFLCILISTQLSAQKRVMEFYALDTYEIDLSDSMQENYTRRDLLNEKLETKIGLDSAEKAELDSLWMWLGEGTTIYQIVGEGCSWYCEGGNDSVYASSSLDSIDGKGFSALGANDLLYNTAWIEGAKGDGVGEYLEYFFANKSARITEIKIANGYMNSEIAWNENNRVKKLKLTVNGRAYGVLNLQDARTSQTFKIGLLGHNMDGTKLVLKFEIMEVYSGTKYDNTAITEIYFDGIDVH